MAIDVGTGSGAIALALATEGRFARVYGTDISLDALAVARRERGVGRAARCARRSISCTARCSARCATSAPRGRVESALHCVGRSRGAAGERARLGAGRRAVQRGVTVWPLRRGSCARRPTVLEPDGLFAIEVDARRASLAAELVARERRFHAVRVELDLTGRERFVLARRLD